MHQYKGGTQGQMYWYHYNNKKDVAGLTKQNGNSHHNYRYEPYGAVLPENGNFTDPHNQYTLTGKEFDENTGLVWFGARHYEPETGVWMGQDSYRGRLSEPMSLHRFGYVENNPVNYWDWYGFSSLDDAAERLKKNKKYRKKKKAMYYNWYGSPEYVSGYTDEQLFKEWYRYEKKHKGWIKQIPLCPVQIEIKSDGKSTINPNDNTWHEPFYVDEDDDGIRASSIRKYHSNLVSFEMRSMPSKKGHGNQCNYDEYGILLTDIPSSGTADLYSPPEGWRDFYSDYFSDHQENDVYPYNLALSLDKRYNRKFTDKDSFVRKYYEVRPLLSETLQCKAPSLPLLWNNNSDLQTLFLQ
jgi:RHS repeat-associated protein